VAHFPWASFFLGAGTAVAGFGLLALNSWFSPAVRRSGKRAHWLLGFGVNGLGMVFIGAGWFVLALLPPRLDWPPLPWIGFAVAVAGGSLYLASAAHVGRLRAPSRYSIDLDVSGPYSIVRHPQALALSLMAVGLGGLSQSLPYLVLLPLWVALWYLYSWLEEALELVPVFGERYRDYARVTARMFPPPDHSVLERWVSGVTLFRSVPDSTRSSSRR
jgi:protein-S-isoprenylcysteine O-methyltransferase Ste14